MDMTKRTIKKFTYRGTKEKKILELLKKRPFFLDEIADTKGRKTSTRQTLRNLKSKGYDICWYLHKYVGKNVKYKIPSFFIIFYPHQRLEAWRMILKRFPKINKSTCKWVGFGKPILDGLIKSSRESKI